MVRVRFAPSPTGIPHVGNIRTALFDYFMARANDGVFILRIEDTDQARKVEGAEEAIRQSLTWLGANWDEHVTQSERLSEYQKYARQLVEKGLAREEDGAVRFTVRKNREAISWIDAIGGKKVSYEPENVEDFIILKADGYPTYHLANVVDDHLMEITHVIRGEDWIPSTPKHILLYEAFGWQAPVFAHVPNVLGTDGKKLSKRRGAKSVLDFRTDGYLSQSLLNYLMLLGWSPKDDREILSKEDIEKEFSLEKVNSSPSIFDERKLLWMNGEYIRSMSNNQLKMQLLDFDPQLKEYDLALVEQLIEPAKTRMKLLSEFKMLIDPFVQGTPVTPNSSLKEEFFEKIASVEGWENEKILEVIKDFLAEHQLRFPDLYQLIIGVKQGLPLSDVFEIIGRDKTLSLLK